MWSFVGFVVLLLVGGFAAATMLFMGAMLVMKFILMPFFEWLFDEFKSGND